MEIFVTTIFMWMSLAAVLNGFCLVFLKEKKIQSIVGFVVSIIFSIWGGILIF